MNEEFWFQIVCTGIDETYEDFEQRFWDAGCEEAGISFMNGMIVADFPGGTGSPREQITVAIEKVRRADATVVRVEPDSLVPLSEAACRSGLTVDAIRGLSREAGDLAFPTPVARIVSDEALYMWPDVAFHLVRKGLLTEGELRFARAVADANADIEKSPTARYIDLDGTTTA